MLESRPSVPLARALHFDDVNLRLHRSQDNWQRHRQQDYIGDVARASGTRQAGGLYPRMCNQTGEKLISPNIALAVVVDSSTLVGNSSGRKDLYPAYLEVLVSESIQERRIII